MGKDKPVVTVNKRAIYPAAALVVILAAFFTYLRSSSADGSDLSFNQAVGKQAPDFALEAIDGKTVKLSDYRGKTVVLFFNEGSMCYPACWNQMSELGKDKRFSAADVAAFSIVGNPRKEWEDITKKTPGFSGSKILFDTELTASQSYGVLSLPSSMHKGAYPGHTYFIIDKDGVIRYALDDPRMAIQNERLFSEIQKIGSA